MTTLRFKLLDEAFGKKAVQVDYPSGRVSDYFGQSVFSLEKMKSYLSKTTFKTLSAAVEAGAPLTHDIAEEVAQGMKQWAIEMGATHYTHWFQPLTGGTAEKHDAFAEFNSDKQLIEEFSGKLLVQQEPDASSFPSGGIRNTFEARGYTAWDPASPAFVVGDTLCIPTIFISYTGEALDYKAPLLKALAAVDKNAVKVCNLFDEKVTKVFSYLGWEQEYFLVDGSLWAGRPDLMLTGRTLMGHDSAKNQQLEDHYFGHVPSRVLAFMTELEVEAHKLGIPVKTRHNEVAPNQYELAPIYEETNLAVDHNLLVMSVMRRVARRHGFRVVLHEKPFKGINGSGKHCNWSLGTDTGVNLLAPAKDAVGNLQFVTFVANVLKAVHTHNGLLKASISSATNAHRLGANEAPPAIISIFLGDELEGVVRAIIDGSKHKASDAVKMELGAAVLPTFIKDNPDRNRTSPFAFTGNKFEFRMPGSEVNLSDANMVLNTIVAKALSDFSDAVEGKKDFEKATRSYMKKVLTDHQRIIFNGDNYSEEWPKEAARRGLLNLKSTPEALPQYVAEESIEVFNEFRVLSRAEVESRYEVKLDHYSKKINIEGLTTARLARRNYLPAIIEFSTAVANSIEAKEDAGVEAPRAEKDLLKKLNACIDAIYEGAALLEEEIQGAAATVDSLEKAQAFCTRVLPAMQNVREAV
ncbi:MAG: glutamine synthetase III, partial [Prevotellaceae bacterium]|nr:glutamine synthetase III [Prevotellaceae bacterium]